MQSEISQELTSADGDSVESRPLKLCAELSEDGPGSGRFVRISKSGKCERTIFCHIFLRLYLGLPQIVRFPEWKSTFLTERRVVDRAIELGLNHGREHTKESSICRKRTEMSRETNGSYLFNPFQSTIYLSVKRNNGILVCYKLFQQ